MIHPFKQWKIPKPYEQIPKVEVTLSMCTLVNGKPNGLAIIHYTDPIDDKSNSFKGVGLFTDGLLHNGPFTCVRGDGWGRIYSQMIKGRPADFSFRTEFFPMASYTRHIDSLTHYSSVRGMQGWTSQIQDGAPQGHGKIWLSHGRIFIGNFEYSKMKEGKLLELQPDNTYTEYHVTYNAFYDAKDVVDLND